MYKFVQNLALWKWQIFYFILFWSIGRHLGPMDYTSGVALTFQ